MDTKHELRHGNYIRESKNVSVQTGVVPFKQKINVNFYIMPPESLELRPDLAPPNRVLKTHIINAYKQRASLPEQQLGTAPGWSGQPKPSQEKTMQELLSIRRANNRGHGGNGGYKSPPLNEIFDKKYYYFGYGSNTNETIFKRRCPSASIIGVAKLSNYELEFRSVANICEKRGSVVYGLLWKISERDYLSLDKKEGVETGSYERKIVEVSIKGKTVKVVTYVMTDLAKTYRSIASPSETYLASMELGYSAHGVPQKQVIDAKFRAGPEKPGEQKTILTQRREREEQERRTRTKNDAIDNTETDAETDEIADPNPIKRSKNSDLTEGGGTHRTNNDVSGGGYHGDYIPLQEVIDTVDRMLNRIFDWEAKPVAAYKFPVKGEVKEKTGYNKVNKLTEFLLYGTADNPKIVSKSGHALWHIIMAAKPSGVSWATHSEGITDDDVVYLKIRLDPGYSFNDIVEKFLEFIRSYNFSQEYRKKPKPPKPPKPPKKDRQTYDYK